MFSAYFYFANPRHARYLHVRPSPARLAHYRGDLTAILLIATEVLPTLATSIDKVFHVDPRSNPGITEIHAKCNHLLSALAIVGSPLKVLDIALEEAASLKPKNRTRKRAILMEKDSKVSAGPNEKKLLVG